MTQAHKELTKKADSLLPTSNVTPRHVMCYDKSKISAANSGCQSKHKLYAYRSKGVAQVESESEFTVPQSRESQTKTLYDLNAFTR